MTTIVERRSALEEALRRVADGDTDALAEVYDRAGKLVYVVCLRVLRNAADAEETAHETWLQVFTQAAQFDPSRGTAAAWLTILARSRALDRLRQRRVREASPLGDLPGRSAAPGPAPDELAWSSEVAHRLRDGLARLPDDQRLLVELSFLGGLSHTEIARARRMPLGTVKTRIRGGLARLRRVLTSPEHEFEAAWS